MTSQGTAHGRFQTRHPSPSRPVPWKTENDTLEERRAWVPVRKSINLGGGVRLNLSKGGVGWSVGGKGYRYTHSPRGYDRRTLSVPGTGLSYVKQSGRSQRKASSPRRETALVFLPPEKPASKPPSPGLFASRYEKEFAAGVKHLQAGRMQYALEAFERASAADDKNKAQADDLLLGLVHAQLGEIGEAIMPLEKVVSSEVELPDDLVTKYLSDFRMTVTYAAEFPADVLLDSVAAGMVLAECYRKHGRTEEAIGLLQQLAAKRPDPHFFLALAELYSETGDHDDLKNLLEEPDVKKLPFEFLTVIQAFYANWLLSEDREEEAFALLESTYLTWFTLEQNLMILIVLCGIFMDAERWDDVIRTVASYEVTNSDDQGFKLKLLQAQAMERKGINEAALAVYKELLKSKPRDPTKFATTVAQIERERRQRDPELLKEARYLRGRLYLTMGKHAMGNRDLSAVYAEDPNYKDVAQLLEA